MMKTASALALVLAAGLAACSPSTETPAAPVEVAAPAIAPIPASADVYPFQIGALQAAALRDAGFSMPNDNKTIAITATKTDTDALLAAAGLPTDTLSLSVQPMIVKSADKVVLFDTGVGAGGGGALAASLASAGVDPASVTDILISHSHFDHVGGLVTADGALAFPNAAIRMSEAEWTFMQANAQYAAMLPVVTPKVVTFAPGAEVIPGLVAANDIKGHTPGHSGYRITSDGASLLYIGDTMHHSVISVQRPDWTIQFDTDAPTAQQSRKAVLAAEADSGERIYAVHFPFPGLGKFERKDDTFVWTAE